MAELGLEPRGRGCPAESGWRLDPRERSDIAVFYLLQSLQSAPMTGSQHSCHEPGGRKVSTTRQIAQFLEEGTRGVHGGHPAQSEVLPGHEKPK